MMGERGEELAGVRWSGGMWSVKMVRVQGYQMRDTVEGEVKGGGGVEDVDLRRHVERWRRKGLKING